VLQDETDEGVVERLSFEWQGEDVRLQELHVAKSSLLGPPPGLRDRIRGEINRREPRIRAPRREGDRLGADATSNLQHHAAGWVRGVGVQ
jgi:hypothetical protein